MKIEQNTREPLYINHADVSPHQNKIPEAHQDVATTLMLVKERFTGSLSEDATFATKKQVTRLVRAKQDLKFERCSLLPMP